MADQEAQRGYHAPRADLLIIIYDTTFIWDGDSLSGRRTFKRQIAIIWVIIVSGNLSNPEDGVLTF